MDLRRASGFILLLLALSIVSFATPMKPDEGAILRRAAEPETHYPVARVGWDAAEAQAKPFNPIYESMMYTVSAEALRDQFLRVAAPNPGVWLSVLGVVFLLRMMRRERERVNRAGLKVIVMPVRPTRAREAA
jgi:hypothetical protein